MRAPELQWAKSGRKRTTATAEQTIWPSKCGRYRIVRNVSMFEKMADGKQRTTYYAVKLEHVAEHQVWAIISEHWSKPRAAKACNDHARGKMKGKKNGLRKTVLRSGTRTGRRGVSNAQH